MEYTLTEIFKILLKRIPVILLCSILGIGGAYAVSTYLMDKQYTAVVSMYSARNYDDADIYALMEDLDYAQEVVNTYIAILKTNDFLHKVSVQSGLGYTTDTLKEMVVMKPVNDTEIFEIRVTSKNPEDSLTLANTIAKLAPRKIEEIKSSDSLSVVDPAALPTKPSSPNVLLNTVFGFLLGLLLGAGLAFTLEALDKRVKDEDELLARYKVPVLGVIPLIDGKQKEFPVLTEKTDFSVTEAFKAARTNLIFTVQNHKGNRLIVTSAAPNEGKSTNCCNLGITLAEMHSRVLIMDCDLRKPVIHKFFDKQCVPGLSEYLAGLKDDFTEVVQNTAYPELNILCGGTIPPNPAELLSSSKMSVLLDSLCQEYDYILLDTPPVNLVADAIALSALSDGVIYVIRQGKTTHPELMHALASFKFANAKVLGIFLNGVGMGSYGKRFGYKRYRNYYRTHKPV